MTWRRPSVLDNSRQKNLGMVYVAMKHAPSRWVLQRYQAVALVLQGYPYAQVSQIIGRSLATISHYLQAYRHRSFWRWLAAVSPSLLHARQSMKSVSFWPC